MMNAIVLVLIIELLIEYEVLFKDLFFYCMEQEKASLKTQTGFLESKRFLAVPNFMLKTDFEQCSKVFGMYQLERSWLNCNKIFRDLVNEIHVFNKQLMEMKNRVQISNYLKTYHLYKNLYEHLNNLNAISATINQARSNLNNVRAWFDKEKINIRSIKIHSKLPEINCSDSQNKEEQENLKQILSNGHAKRQYQPHQFLSKTAYPQYLPYKDRTFQYKKQQENTNLSSPKSAFTEQISEQHSIKSNFTLQSQQLSSKSFTNLSSTQFTSQVKNDLKKSINQKTQIINPFSKFFLLKNKFKLYQSNLKTENNLNKIVKIKNNKQNFQILDSMVKNDKIDQIINEPEVKLIKNLTQNKDQKSNQIHSINSSRLSFILKTHKTQFINRKQFISIESQLVKSKNKSNRLRTDCNRQSQFRKYLSNHKLSSKYQFSKFQKPKFLTEQINKNIKSIPKTQVDFNSKNQLLSSQLMKNQFQIILEENHQDSLAFKRKQFEESLKKNSVLNVSSVYRKYLNHLPQPNPQNQIQYNSEFQIPDSRHFSQNATKLRSTTELLREQGKIKFRSLTSFRSNSLQKIIGPQKQLSFVKTLGKIQLNKFNEEAANEVVQIKLRMSKNVEEPKTQPIVNKILFKGLKLEEAPQETLYEVIRPKLLSNPFFVFPKTKKPKKKKKR